MKKAKYPGIGIILLVILTIALIKCSGDGASNSVKSYGGTDPAGDFIVVTLDKSSKTVLHKNFTTGETNGPFGYVQETDTSKNGGFSILYRVDLPVSSGGGYVLFAEFEDAALVYQMFDDAGDSVDNPVYAVYREEVDKTTFYGKAYNWTKFFIDTTGSDDDMSVGFAAFDDEASGGLLYGASYSRVSEAEGDPGNGIGDINEGDTADVATMTWDETSTSNIMWFDGVSNWDDAIALTGTASGASVLDFGPGLGGGGALVVPQTDLVDNITTWWTSMAGTYLMLIYETDTAGSFKEVKPMKCVIGSDGSIKVFDFEDNTSSATPTWQDTFAKVTDTDGPRAEKVSESFKDESGNQLANSSVVKNAHECKGAFVALDEGAGDHVVTAVFDPQGRFMGFTGFFDTGAPEDTIRFGFAIKDSGYSNSGL